MKKNRCFCLRLPLLLSLLALCLLTACGTEESAAPLPSGSGSPIGVAGAQEPLTPETDIPQDSLPPHRIQADLPEAGADAFITGSFLDIMVYHSLEDRFRGDPIVALGHFTREVDPGDEAPRPIRLYRFRAQRTLGGAALPEEITVGMEYGQTMKGEISNAEWNDRGELVKEATAWDPYAFFACYPHFAEPEPDQPMMVFLSYLPEQDAYFLSGAPAMIALYADRDPELVCGLLDTPENRTVLRTPQIFYSEGGQPIYHYPAGPQPEIVEDFLAGVSMDALLTAAGVTDPAEREAIRADVLKSNE